MNREKIEKKKKPGETENQILDFLDANGESTRKKIMFAIGRTPDQTLARLYEKGYIDFRFHDGIRDRFWFFVKRELKNKKPMIERKSREEQIRIGRKQKRIYMTDQEHEMVVKFLEQVRREA